jgi:hypothetical protein
MHVRHQYFSFSQRKTLYPAFLVSLPVPGMGLTSDEILLFQNGGPSAAASQLGLRREAETHDRQNTEKHFAEKDQEIPGTLIVIKLFFFIDKAAIK